MTRGFSAMRVDAHVERELDLGRLDHAGDRRGGAVMRRRGERHVAFAAQQARGRVEADPAGAGQIDFGPGVQIGEIVLGARRPVERLDVGPQLNEIAGDEARGRPRWRRICTSSQAESRQEPEPQVSVSSGVCTPGSMRMRYLISLQALIELDQEVDGVAGFARTSRRSP